MPKFLKSDVFKIFLYVAGVLLLTALLAPVLYNLGKGLAEITADKQTARPVKWLADAAARSGFPRFFDRALLISALVLIFPLLAWLKRGKGEGKYRDTPWSLWLPESKILPGGQPLRRNPKGGIQMALGFLLGYGPLLLAGWIAIRLGYFYWRDVGVTPSGEINAHQEAIHWGSILLKALPGMIVVSILEEILFRGILMGIFLRAMRPVPAIILLSLLFSFVHFLQPPPGTSIPDPDAKNAGFVMMGLIFSRYADPVSLAARFAVLAVVGGVLALARYRTRSLWLPVGLHGGWVLGMVMFKAGTWAAKQTGPSSRFIVGDTMLEGLLPLAIVILTGGVVWAMTRRKAHEDF